MANDNNIPRNIPQPPPDPDILAAFEGLTAQQARALDETLRETYGHWLKSARAAVLKAEREKAEQIKREREEVEDAHRLLKNPNDLSKFRELEAELNALPAHDMRRNVILRKMEAMLARHSHLTGQRHKYQGR